MRSNSPTCRCRRRRTFPTHSAAACAARSQVRPSSAAAGRGFVSWASTTAALTALPDLRAQAKTELCVALGGVVLGTLGIADTRKSEAAAVVAQLRAAGKEVWMMTGDHARTAEAIAAEVGIDHVLSEVRPDEKAAAIERLRAQGKTVCMVGDGINDTPALAVADCAVAMGGGSDIAIESAGILLPSGNLEKLPELFDISARPSAPSART
ncbi:MAG: HAD-IC family P-type ATPase [Oscillospiraceae bacterium]